MAQVTIYHDADVTVNVVDGAPPDTAALQAQLDAANAQIAQLQADNVALRDFANLAIADAQARKDADAGKVEGQDVLDAAANLPTTA